MALKSVSSERVTKRGAGGAGEGGRTFCVAEVEAEAEDEAARSDWPRSNAEELAWDAEEPPARAVAPMTVLVGSNRGVAVRIRSY